MGEQERSGEKMVPLPAAANLLLPVMRWAREQPARAVAARRDGDRLVDVTAEEFYRRCRETAKGLIASGLQPGDRVALMSATRLEWLLLDYAIMASGCITVPIYETSSAEQVVWILGNSGAAMLVVESAAMRDLLDAAGPAMDARPEILVVDDGALDELARRGQVTADSTLDHRIGGVTAANIATIVYTSGTTGRPKGCVLTHGNLCTNVRQNIDAIRSMLQPDETILLFLPLAHVLTKIIALVCVEWGAKLAFSPDMASLPDEFAAVRPTLIVAVPRVFEKVFNGAQQKAHGEGHAAVFEKAADVAVHWSEYHGGRFAHPLMDAEHIVFDQLVYKKIHAVFGGRLRFAFSGGGPLGERLTHFFNGVGVKVFEGYGLTETSPTLTLNRADAWKPGTVGRPLAETTIRIAPDGEILAGGPQVFRGYWRNEGATAAIFDPDGWFLTGDIGELDDDGFLRITGRKKELIVTAAGKNVAPAPLEDRLRAHPLISQALVVGNARPFVAALLTIDEEAFRAWADERALSVRAVAELITHPMLLTEMQEAIDEANMSVSRAESIRKFTVLPHDLSVGNGELTPTLKLRRSVVEKAYAHLIDALYAT